MSTRIPLAFDEFWDPRWVQQGIASPIIRIVARVAFAMPGPDAASTEQEYAIVDTGAPISLLPRSIWQRCAVERKAEGMIRGVVPKPECQMPAPIGAVTCYLLAASGDVVSVPLIAYLAPVDNVALLLGFASLLEQFQLIVDRHRGVVFLEG